jgi:hypothetical protein
MANGLRQWLIHPQVGQLLEEKHQQPPVRLAELTEVKGRVPKTPSLANRSAMVLSSDSSRTGVTGAFHAPI